MTFENLEVLQSNQKRRSEHGSVYSTSNCMNSCTLRWSSSGSNVAQISSSEDVNINVDYLARHANHIKQSGFQLLHQDSSSTQSTSQSRQEEMSEGNFHDECVSSQSGTDANEKQNDDMKSEPPLGNPDIIFPRPKFDSNQATACYSYPYGDPYQMGLMAAYGSHVVVHPQLLGMTSALAPLPLQPEEGPIYVNPKQYHRILQRRQERAKLEAQNKITKERRPYLHESRHIHALKRVRGSGGRFLNTKQLQQQAQTSGTMGIQVDSGSSLQRAVGSSATSTCSGATNSSNSSDMFQQHHHHSVSVGTQSHGGVADSIRFMLRGKE